MSEALSNPRDDVLNDLRAVTVRPTWGCAVRTGVVTGWWPSTTTCGSTVSSARSSCARGRVEWRDGWLVTARLAAGRVQAGRARPLGQAGRRSEQLSRGCPPDRQQGSRFGHPRGLVRSTPPGLAGSGGACGGLSLRHRARCTHIAALLAETFVNSPHAQATTVTGGVELVALRMGFSASSFASRAHGGAAR